MLSTIHRKTAVTATNVLKRSISKTATPSALSSVQDNHFEYSKSLPMFDFFAQTKPKPSFKFGHGATGFAKRRANQVAIHTFNSYTSVGAQIGEDAYFRRSDAIGVADGIGGWSNTAGSDSALYSTQLMHYANLEMDRFEDIEDPLFFDYNDANPVEILQRSYDKSLVAAKKNNILGSTTACLAVLRHDELRVANIGDCGISIIRNNHYIFRSEEQQHAFNFPYQLGIQSRDQPSHAQSFTIKVQKNDIVIMGTDGLYDNLFDRDILDLVRAHVDAHTIPGAPGRPPRISNLQPQTLSDILGNTAKEISESKHRVDTPFQRRAMEEGFLMEGGKPDDISVIVAVVKDCEDSPDRRSD
ncbi:phosphatase 2C-like domain-containing protein [Choanephora cucurbitarum]|nr:phosphatase 2C-like domain-containing protein [Choanephora cucurbitarum]